MKKFVPVLLVASALAVAAPAFAAPVLSGGGAGAGVGQPYRGGNFRERIEQLENRIERGRRHGGISRREAERLTANLWDIRRLERRYRATGGLSRWERRDLDQRLDRLAAQIRYERRDGDDRRGDGGYRDRDRDGRPDRYEDDGGRRPDR